MSVCLRRPTFDMRDRRSGNAAKGTCKRSLQVVPLDGIVRRIRHALLSLIEAEVVKIAVNDPDDTPSIYVAFISEEKRVL